jgi:hypothetical protein
MCNLYPAPANFQLGTDPIGPGRRSIAAALALLAVAACSRPDYSAVREWANSADLAIGYPPATAPCQPVAAHETAPRTPDPRTDGVHTMQQALATYLSALAILADDGTLPYREDPFTDLKSRAATVSKSGADAVATLGAMLRKATIDNDRAPQLRDMIRHADQSVQALIAALQAVVPEIGANTTWDRQNAAGRYAAFEGTASDVSVRQDVRYTAAPRDWRITDRLAVRTIYLQVLAEVAWGHAVLKQRASHLSQEETIRLVRVARNRLLRAEAPLPALFVVVPGGIACSSPPLPETTVPSAGHVSGIPLH